VNIRAWHVGAVLTWSLVIVGCEEEDTVSPAAGRLVASETLIDFGEVPLGQTAVRAFELQNEGGTSEEVRAVGGLSGVFDVEPLGTTLPFDVTPGSSGRFQVEYTPSELAESRQELRIETSGDPIMVEVSGTGIIGLELEPALVDFGVVLAGSSQTATVALTNLTSEEVQLSLLNSTGRTGTMQLVEQPQLEAEGLTLGSQETRLVSVRYASALGEERTDEASYDIGFCESSGCRVTLQARGRASLAGLACETSKDFGFIEVGATRTELVSCTNVASQPIRITGSGIAGSGRFALLDGPDDETEVAPGAEFEFEIIFQAREDDVGLQPSAVLQVSSEDLEGQGLSLEETTLIARVGPPVLTLRPETLDFGLVAAGTSLSLSVELANEGRSELIIDEIVLPEGLDELSILGSRPSSISPGGTVELELLWAPEQGAPDLDDLVRIVSNAPAEGELGVVGRVGAPGQCFFNDDPATVTFGPVTAFHLHTSFMVFENTGSSACNLRTLPSDAGDFSWADDDASYQVPAGGRQLVMIDYRPSSLGSVSSARALRWYVDSPLESDRSVEVRGRGSDRRPFVYPAYQDFGYYPDTCETVTATLTVRNSTFEAVTVTDVSLTGDSAFALVDTPPVPFVVAPESFEYVRVSFRPALAAESESFGRYRLLLDGMDEIEGTLHARTGTESTARQVLLDGGDSRTKLDVLVRFTPTNEPTPSEEDIQSAQQARRELSTLLELMDTAAVDYHIGLLSSQGGQRFPSGWPFPCPRPEDETGQRTGLVRSGSCGYLHERVTPEGSVERFVTPDSEPSPSQALEELLFPPGSLLSDLSRNIEKALSPPWVFEHNAGFLRPDANVLIIDLQSRSGSYDSLEASFHFSDFYKSLLGRHFRARLRFFGATFQGESLGVGGSGPCMPDRTQPYSPQSLLLSLLAYPLGGGGDILCREQASWGTDIFEKFTPLPGRRRRIPLEQRFAPGTLKVFVDGTELTPGSFEESSPSWRLNPTEVEILFVPPPGNPRPELEEDLTFRQSILEFSEAAQPAPGARVEVEFEPTCQ